jgi:hypothetical protein
LWNGRVAHGFACMSAKALWNRFPGWVNIPDRTMIFTARVIVWSKSASVCLPDGLTTSYGARIFTFICMCVCVVKKNTTPRWEKMHALGLVYTWC